MKQLIYILALVVAIFYTGEANGDERQGSLSNNIVRQNYPKNNTYHNRSRRPLKVLSCRQVLVYRYNQFGNRVYFYIPVYHVNKYYVKNDSAPLRHYENYNNYGSFIIGGWR